jgi:predicted ribosome quality control (RQC) complex YloA/Tae2 family protein
MIQTHQNLKTISEEYNSLFSKNEFYPLQKAYTTPHFLVFSVRFPGKSVHVYIGRGNQYQGIYLSEKAPPSYLRVQDRLLDYARKFLVGTRLGKCEVDEKYMFSLFHFKTDHTDNSFSFGYKDRQLFFLKQSKDDVYTSWNGETRNERNILKLVDEIQPDRGKSQSRKIPTIESYLEEEAKKNGGKPLQKKKEKFLARKLENITRDFEEVKNWKKLESDLLNDKINLDQDIDEVNLYGQRIKFHGMNSPWMKRDLLFKKIKKLKKAEEILETRLKETEIEFEKVKSGEFDLDVTKEKVIQPLWITHAKSNSKAVNKDFNYKEFKIKNISGVIALDASSNDFIRTQAHKEHYWFHVENYPGSHCILKTEDFAQLGLLELEAIASLLRDFSRLNITEIPVLYSQLKNIKGIKGSKGEVIVKKPKHLRCVYRDWKEIITVL